MSGQELLIPVDKEWGKLAKEVILRLGLTWEEWVWLIDKIKPAIEERNEPNRINPSTRG